MSTEDFMRGIRESIEEFEQLCALGRDDASRLFHTINEMDDGDLRHIVFSLALTKPDGWSWTP